MYRRHESMGVRSVKRGVLRRGGRLLWHGCSPDDVVEVRIRLLGIHEAHSNHAMANGGKRGGFGLGFGSSWSSRLYLPPQSIATGDDDPPGRHHREARGGQPGRVAAAAAEAAKQQRGLVRLVRERSRGGGSGRRPRGVGHRLRRGPPPPQSEGCRRWPPLRGIAPFCSRGNWRRRRRVGGGCGARAAAIRAFLGPQPLAAAHRVPARPLLRQDTRTQLWRGTCGGSELAEDGYAQTPSSSSSFSGKRRGDSRSSKAKPLPTFSSKGHGGWGLRDLLASEYSGARFPHLDAPHGGDYGLDDGGAFLDSWHSSGFGGDDDDDDNENDNDWGGFRDLPLMIGASRHDNEGRKGRAGRVGASSSATGARTRLKLRVMDSSHWSPSLDLDGFGGAVAGMAAVRAARQALRLHSR